MDDSTTSLHCVVLVIIRGSVRFAAPFPDTSPWPFFKRSIIFDRKFNVANSLICENIVSRYGRTMSMRRISQLGRIEALPVNTSHGSGMVDSARYA